MLKIYPYNLQPDIKLTSIFKDATGTQLPYVRADWFAFYASRPPLYNSLLKLGANFPGARPAIRASMSMPTSKSFRWCAAGFQKSGVSANNRLIERHPSRSGYFWTSYDFGSNEGVKNLFEHPLGPVSVAADGFQQDGGETIFSLPNGFQGYYLNNAKGEKLDKGPTNIVRDLSSKDLAVTNGISCMGCHDQGMRKAKDDIRDVVLAGRAFSKELRDAVDVLYPPHDRRTAIIDDDAKRFADAMIRAGLDPTLKLNGVEMTNALSKRYEDDMDARLAAADLGLTKDQYEHAVDDADKKFRPLLRRLQQATVPFDQFEGSFRELAASITDDVIVDVGGGTSTPVRCSSRRGPTSRPIWRSRRTRTLISRAIRRRSRSWPRRDCALTLTDVDDRGEGVVLFPNKFHSDNHIKKGVAITLPGDNAGFQYRMKDKGTETVIAVCSESGDSADGIKHDFAKAPLTTVPNYTASVSRSIQVVSDCKRSIAVEATSSGSACGGVSSQQAALPAKPVDEAGDACGAGDDLQCGRSAREQARIVPLRDQADGAVALK